MTDPALLYTTLTTSLVILIIGYTGMKAISPTAAFLEREDYFREQELLRKMEARDRNRIRHDKALQSYRRALLDLPEDKIRDIAPEAVQEMGSVEKARRLLIQQVDAVLPSNMR